MKRKSVLKIGISAGDPAGIGPEVILKALHAHLSPHVVPVVIGSADVFSAHYRELFTDLTILSSPDEIDPLHKGMGFFIDVPHDGPVPEPGRGSLHTGRESLKYINAALDLWKSGYVDALVTAPVSKAFIEASGTPFTGHTEYIAHYTGGGDPYMMMYSSRYRVILATTHIPLAGVPRAVSCGRLKDVMRAGYRAMEAIDGGRVRLAVTGLDPHCGDDGAIGSFDREVTVRAVEEARSEGMQIEGPFAADTLFIPSKWEQYNCVVAHYHDQGLIPFKLLAFDEGVNVTLGLDITRTSVDHGTAFDIAGKDRAAYTSMVEAIKVACFIESRKQEQNV